MPFDNPFGDPFGPMLKRRTTAPLLTPEEEASLLESLGHSTLGGLAAVGTVLDTPGAFVRTALAGENPFAGIFDPSQRVGGRELLEGWGVLDANTDGFDGGDVAGFAADVLLDPTTYLTLGMGALNKAGKASLAGIEGAKVFPRAVRGAGEVLETGVRQQLAKEGMGGVARLSVPFTDIGVDLSTPALGRAMDFTGEAIRYGELPFTNFSPGRAAAAMFSKGVKNTYTKPAQIAAQAMTEAERLAGEEALGEGLQAYRGLEEIGTPDQLRPVLDKAVEGMPLEDADLGIIRGAYSAKRAASVPVMITREMKSRLGEAGFTPDDIFNMTPQQAWEHLNPAIEPESVFQSVVDTMVTRKNDSFRKLQETGRYMPELNDIGIEHFPRQLNAAAAADRPGSRIFPTRVDFAKHRADDIRDLPREALERMSGDPQLIGPQRLKGEAAAEYVRQTYFPQRDFQTTQALRDQLGNVMLDATNNGNWNGLQDYITQVIGGNVPLGGDQDYLLKLAQSQLDEFDRLLTQPSSLASRFGGLPDQALGRKMFNDPTLDFARYERQVKQSTAASDGIADFLSKHTGGEGVPLVQVLKKAHFAGPQGQLTSEIVQKMAGKLGYSGVPGQELSFLNKINVPEDIAADVTRMIDGFSAPEGLRPALDTFDWFTQTFKLGVTTPWPSFHTRNMATGLWQNLVGGALDVRSYSDAYKLLRGDVVESALEHPLVKKAGITDPAQASNFLRDNFYQFNVAGQSFTNEITGRFVPPSENFAGNILGEPGAELSLMGIKDAAVEGAQAGAAQGGNRISSLLKGAVGGAVGYGKHAGDLVESLNRAAGFLALTKQGFDPSIAAAKIRALHVDFGNLSSFERGVMRRLVPFYSWSKGMIPEVLTELAQRPGGLTGQVAQLSGSIRDGEDAFLPEHLQGGLGLPLGETSEDGTQRFLTNLDLPPESVFEPLHTGPNGLNQTGLDMLSMLNPLIKAPLEMATGKQFFTGRDIRDLHSNTGIPIADELIMNSPFARVLSTGNQVAQLVEGRKDPLTFGLNTLTGARVSDVDLPKHRSIAARELIEDSLRGEEGVGFFEHMSLKPGALEQLSPEDQQMFLLYRQLSNRAQKEARDRKKAQPLQIGIAR